MFYLNVKYIEETSRIYIYIYIYIHLSKNITIYTCCLFLSRWKPSVYSLSFNQFLYVSQFDKDGGVLGAIDHYFFVLSNEVGGYLNSACFYWQNRTKYKNNSLTLLFSVLSLIISGWTDQYQRLNKLKIYYDNHWW